MKSKILIYLGAFALILAVSSCTPKTTSNTKEASMSFPTAEIEAGYTLQVQYCVKCHKLKKVTKYSREQWDKILPAMAKKAKLSAEQEASINDYVNWELSKK